MIRYSGNPCVASKSKMRETDRQADNKVILICCLALLAPQYSIHYQIKRRDFEMWTQTIHSSLNLKLVLQN